MILTVPMRISLQSKDTHASNQSAATASLTGRATRVAASVSGNRIKLPKVGFVKIKQSREFGGRILNATVRRAVSGKYFISLRQTEKESLLRPNGGKQIGIDVGLRAFCSDSDGNVTQSPRPLKKLQRKLCREQRRLSRKLPKSMNRDKARVRVARVHERIANIRRDFLHKLSTRLTRENQTVAGGTPECQGDAAKSQTREVHFRCKLESSSANSHTRRNCTVANCSKSIRSTRRVRHALLVAIRTH